MSEKVLEAIIQLLAISANLDGVNEYEKKVIRKFLTEQINDELVPHYMHTFDDFAAQVDTIQAFKIFKQINQELTQQQKVVVITNLIELTVSDGKMSKAEAELLDTVSRAFNFDEEEYQAIQQFIITDDLRSLQLLPLVIIDHCDDREYTQLSSIQHIQREHMDTSSRVGILRIPSLEMYILKYEAGKSNVYLNGLPMRDQQTHVFSAGSSIRADKMRPVYYSDVVGLFLNERQGPQITFEAHQIDYKFSSGQYGLRHINIAEESGRLIGLMGASGSGKSTLLNVLNGNLKPYSGSVKINGLDVHQEEAQLRGIIGYVPQDDLLVDELTVYQNLYYAAKLCCSDYTDQQLDELVSNMLNSLGLFEIKHLRVGSPLQKTISGGQRKRLNIGLELLREPAVLFVDEPTSGLSSQDSENIMDLLKELSLKGKLIFVVIHQPSSDIFKMFDRLLILDIGGYPIYYGNPIEGLIYFKTIANMVDKEEGACVECGNVNPEQIFSIVEAKVVNEYGRFTNKRKVSPKQWYTYYKERLELPTVVTNEAQPTKSLNVPSRLQQWYIYLTRDLLAKLSNTQYLVINLLEAPLLALILAYIVRFYHIDETLGEVGYDFSQNMNLTAYIFMSIIVALFIGLTVSAEEIIRDAKMLKREAFLHLSRNSYLLAKVTILFAFSAVQTFCFVFLGNWMLGIEQMTPRYWGVLFSCACFANLLGLNISATFNSVVTIYILIPLLLIPQLVLGGVVVAFDEINPHLSSQEKVPVVAETMASRWAFEALAVSQFKDNPFEAVFYPYDKEMAQASYLKDYYLPTLLTKLTFCFTNLKNPALQAQVKDDLALLRYEFQHTLASSSTKEVVLSVSPNVFTVNAFNYDHYVKAKQYLETCKKQYVKQYNTTAAQKDALMVQMTRTAEEKANFLARKRQFYNLRLADLVQNTDQAKRVIEYQHQLIRKIYPVFHEEHEEGFFSWRTHFFAPRKWVLGTPVDTLYFNIIALWVMSGLLYLTLYFNLFRRLLEGLIAIWEKISRRESKVIKKL